MENLSFSVSSSEELLGLKLYQYGWEQCKPLHSFGPFVRNHYLFHYVISGKGGLSSYDADDNLQNFSLKAGQGFLISPGQINTYSADREDPWKYIWLEFDGLKASEYLSTAGLGLSQPIYTPERMDQAEELRNIMFDIVNQPKASTLYQIGHLCLFLDKLIQSSSTRRELHGNQLRDFYIQEAVNFMEQNYRRNLTVEEIADVCRLNRSYFSKLFKKSRGCPPQEYLIRIRLAKAEEMLMTSTASIGDIAAYCGYPDQLHFSRLFKQHYGVSPREWRNKNKLYDVH